MQGQITEFACCYLFCVIKRAVVFTQKQHEVGILSLMQRVVSQVGHRTAAEFAIDSVVLPYLSFCVLSVTGIGSIPHFTTSHQSLFTDALSNVGQQVNNPRHPLRS